MKKPQLLAFGTNFDHKSIFILGGERSSLKTSVKSVLIVASVV